MKTSGKIVGRKGWSEKEGNYGSQRDETRRRKASDRGRGRKIDNVEGDNKEGEWESRRENERMEGSKSERARERRSQTVRQAARQARKAGRQASRQPVHQPRPLDPLGLPT